MKGEKWFVIPKTIKICGRDWKIVKDPKCGGGRFAFQDLTISYNPNIHEQYYFETILHEIFEIVFSEDDARFVDENHEGNYVFVFDHDKFQVCVRDFAAAVKQLIKED